MQPWPFEDPPNVAVITVRQVFAGSPILLVARNLDDGTWQFLSGGPIDMADAMLVALDEVLALESSLSVLSDLEPGWQAWRPHPGAQWQVSLSPPDPE
jgi:hypothetical protein